MTGNRPSHSPPIPGGIKPVILAADDDTVTRRVIAAKLEREGYTVLSFNNGEDLLAQARQSKPALIILDLMMPAMDGYSTLRALRADPAHAAVPVLMLSSKNQEDDIVSCLKAGAADFVVKPFSPQELVARVRKLIPRANDTHAQ
jgi:DNA-binding response OmpR family regulator